MNKTIKRSATEMNKRIDDTKREIAQLNEELEKLINSNINKKQSSPVEINETSQRKEQPVRTLTSESKTNINVETTLKNSKPPKSVKDVSIQLSEQGCRKMKTYDQEAAKEYIRHQREKWMEERKKNSSKTNIDKATIKQNLNALSLKSRALVQRNVQLKKEKSRTTSTKGQIRLDRKVDYSPKLDPKTISRSKSKSPRKNTDLKVPKSNLLTVRDSALTETHVITYQEQEPPCLNGVHFPLQNVTIRRPKVPSIPDQLSRPDQDLAATKIQAFYRGHRTRKELKEQPKPKTQISVKTVDCIKESKETQTSIQQKQGESPIWHHTVPVDPYPCNFINTIKRRLQLVVNSPVTSRDVGVQGSILETNKQVVNDLPIAERNARHRSEPSSRSNLDSFLSHKRANLDVDALQNLALLHHRSNLGGTKQQISDSDSDTSKNIPEISTESESVPINKDRIFSNENLTNGFIGINTDKIDKLHLRNPLLDEDKSNSYEGVFNASKGHLVEKSYTFDFYDDKTDDLSVGNRDGLNEEKQREKFTKSPRDSIISFNKSGYNNFPNSIVTENIDNEDNGIEVATSSSLEHRKELDKEKQEGKFLKSSRDSIISFNRSGFDLPKCDVLGNVGGEDIGTGRSTVSPILSSRSSHSENNKLKLSPHDPKVFIQKGLGVASSSSSRKRDRVSKLDIVEDIESSINTSLVSYISDKMSEVSKTSNKNTYSKGTNLKHSNHQYVYENNASGRTSPIVGNLGKSKSHSQRSDSSHVSTYHSRHNKLTNETNSSINSNRSNTHSEDSNENNSQLKTSENSDIPTESFHSKTRSIESIHSMPTRSVGVKIRNNEKMTSQSIASEKTAEIMNVNSRNAWEQTDSKRFEFTSLHSSDFHNSEQVSQEKHNRSEESRLERVNDDEMDCDNEINKSKLNAGNTDTRTLENVTKSVIELKSNSNEIHSKFEAEVHLLNDFNESLKQFMAVEKAFETIKNKSEGRSKTENRNAEISKRSIGLLYSEDSKISLDLSKSIVSSINVSRGTNIDESHDSTIKRHLDNSTGKEISIFGETNIDDGTMSFPNNMAGLSIKMFEQLIRDEDVRIENLKTIIKIREQALLDRTKGELAWLEIQRKHLKETGKIHEASLVKKKQRGILLKHQQERREMQRLKQVQKTRSNERKTILKEQQNLIKAKLTSEKIMTDLRKHTPRRKKSIGPMRVLKSSEHSETSISKKESEGEEIYSVTSTRSRSIQLSDLDSFAELTENNEDTVIRDNENLTNMKRALLMRQSALMKRRKAVEDLLQRHQKLLQEEKKIEELEMAANAIIMQMPTISQPKQTTPKLRVKGQQLNELGLKMNAFTEKKFVDNKTYNIPQASYNKLFVQAENYRSKQKKPEFPEITNNVNTTPENVVIEDESEPSKEPEYSPDFELYTQEIDDVPTTAVVDETNLSSISELIQDFSKIEHGISMLSKQSDPNSQKSSTSSENISESIKEVSVIETNRTTPRTLRSSDKEKTLPSEPLNSQDSTETQEPQSLKDEDISAIIHGMCIPSGTTSEISLISEIEEKDEIISQPTSSQISEEIILDQTTQVVSEDCNIASKEDTIESIEKTIEEENNEDESIKQTSDVSTDDNKLNNIYSDDSEITKHDTEPTAEKYIDDGVIISEELGAEEITTEENFVDELSSDKIENIESDKNDDIVTISEEKVDEIELNDFLEELEPDIPATSDKVSEEHSESEVPETENVEEVLEKTEIANDEIILNETDALIVSECENGNDSINEQLESPIVEEFSTDISEKLSTDNEQVEIQEVSPSQSSSENYTDDFEEDSPVHIQSDENSNSTLSTKAPDQDNEVIDLEKRSDDNGRKSNWSNIPTIMLNGEILSNGDGDHEKDVEAQLSPTKEVGDDKGDKDVNIKQRVSEILANTVDSPKNTGEKTVRYQDYYVTTYEDITPSNSPELETPVKSAEKKISPLHIFGNEAEELLKKQLAIEQEIKHLEQQQKEQLPFVYMREIPNKPPPPYTPPSSVQSTAVTILPSKVEDLNEICNYSAKVLFNAYLSNNLSVFTFSESDFKSINQTKSTKDCCLFVFDLCREVAEDHYKKFEKQNVPSWLRVPDDAKLALGKPYGYRQLEKHINLKVKELLGFEKPNIRESSIIKWNRKKKDHVDEILVLESQAEEREWLNYDNDELMIKDKVTNQIFDILLSETVEVFRKIFS